MMRAPFQAPLLLRDDSPAGVGASGSSPVSHVARSCRGRGKKKRLQGMLAASKGAVTYSPTFAVPSAWRGLTSLFGMGRGGAPALSPPLSFAFVLRHARQRCMTGVSQERRRSVTWKRTQEPSRISRDSLFLSSAFVVGGLSPGKGFGRLVTLGCVHCCTCTCVLSTS